MDSIPEDTSGPPSEDAVLDELHTHVEHKSVDDPEIAPRIHRKFQRCEAYEVYEQYEQGILPTIPQLATAMDSMLSRVPESMMDDAEVLAVTKLLRGRSMQIQGAVQSYVRTIIRFNRLYKLSKGRDVKEQLVKADFDRRKAHDALFDSLTVLMKKLEEADGLGICSLATDVYVYAPGMTTQIPAGRIPAFHRSLLDKTVSRNREFIMQWAIAADFAKSFKQLEEMARVHEK